MGLINFYIILLNKKMQNCLFYHLYLLFLQVDSYVLPSEVRITGFR